MQEGEEKLRKQVKNFRIPASMEKLALEIARAKSMTKAEVIRQALRVGLPIFQASP